MNLFVLLLGSFFALLSSVVIAHVSMVAAMGPFIAPTVVIISGVFAKFRRELLGDTRVNRDLALIQTVASVGGIVAMGIGFTLPMYYFLEPLRFNEWLAQPFQFCSLIAAATISAGGLGIWLARTFAGTLITKEKLSFPVSGLIHKTITSQGDASQARQLFGGFSLSVILSFVRDGFGSFAGFIPRVSYIFPSIFGRDLALGIAPMLWAMGFIAGMGVVFPLVIGMISKYLVLFPLNNHASYLPFALFEPMHASKFAQAFCSGLVLVSISFTVLKFPMTLWRAIKKHSGYDFWTGLKEKLPFFGPSRRQSSLKLRQAPQDEGEARPFVPRAGHSPGDGLSGDRSRATSDVSREASLLQKILSNIEPLAVVLLSFFFLSSFRFGILSQLFMIGLTSVFAYQISYFAGRVGLVPFGRFTTFVMVPTMFLFRLDYLQITILCVFCNIVYGLATDLLFDYKVGQMNGIDFDTVRYYQWFGLIVTALGMGFFFWVLFTNFQIGSEHLFALRAKNRALLLQSLGFDWQPVLLGFLYGLVLKQFKINSMMVFGGILMPGELTIGLVAGAICSWFDSRRQEHQPFWSGLFAGESMWMLTSLVANIL